MYMMYKRGLIVSVMSMLMEIWNSMSIKLFKVDYRVPDDENKLAQHGKSQSLKKNSLNASIVCVCVCVCV